MQKDSLSVLLRKVLVLFLEVDSLSRKMTANQDPPTVLGFVCERLQDAMLIIVE